MTKKEKILTHHFDGLTVNEIAKKTGYTNKSIIAVINRAGFKVNRFSVGKKLDHKFYELILGLVLGDGSICKNNRVSIAHSLGQEEYIRYLHSIFDSYNLAGKLSKNKIDNDRYKDGYIEEFRFRSLTTDKMQGFREFYYKDSKKTVPEESYLFEYLTPFSLAIWYMDDGSRTNYNLQINTQSFTKEEVLRLRYVLLEKFNIKSTTNAENIITIKAKSVDNFIDLVVPYMIPSMVYKLIPYRVLYKLGELQERCDANLQPSLNRNILEGSETTNRVLTDNAEDSKIGTSAQHLIKDDDIVRSVEKSESTESKNKES